MSIGSEYRHMTITSTFLATPKRVHVMVAKVTSLLGIGVFYGLVFLLGSVGVGATTIAIKGYPPIPEVGTITRTLALSLLVLGLWALIGLGVGILIPNQVAAILIAVGAAWIVFPLGGLLLGFVSWGKSIVPYLPSEATSAMVGALNSSTNVKLLSWWAGALVLVAYATLMAGIGSLLTVRRDVT
jgi:ABC-2 type transport system permease protein